MDKIYGSVKKILNVKHKIRVDSLVSRLHYRLTVAILVGSAVLVTGKGLIGTNILCTTDLHDVAIAGVASRAITSYCWVSSTFSVPKHFDKAVPEEVPHPGVGPYLEEDERVYHAYYIWVPHFLTLQAILFYLPHLIWKSVGAKEVNGVIAGLDSYTLSKEQRDTRLGVLAKYFIRTLNQHNAWFITFLVFEIVNLINIIGQISFADTFLGGEFSSYGSEVLEFSKLNPENRTDPMSRVFPIITQCTWHHYGPSGTIQKYDSMCILPQNILNEKVYTFLWFYFIVLAVISAIWVVYLLLTFLPAVRGFALVVLDNVKDSNSTNTIMKHAQIGDWFLLRMLGKHMDPLVYREFVKIVAEKIEGEEKTKTM